MKSSWGKLYDSAKDRRNGMLFVISLVAFFGVLILAKVASNIWSGLALNKPDFEACLLFASPGIFFLITALIWREVRRDRTPQKKTSQCHELSRDEILKARSKLMKAKTR